MGRNIKLVPHRTNALVGVYEFGIPWKVVDAETGEPIGGAIQKIVITASLDDFVTVELTYGGVQIGQDKEVVAELRSSASPLPIAIAPSPR